MLIIDPERIGNNSGIPIRASFNNKYGTYDLAELTRASLLEWLSESPFLPINTVFAIFSLDRLDESERNIISENLKNNL